MCPKYDSIVTKDSILNQMMPLTEGNAKVNFSSVWYHYLQYIENGGYSCNENYWAPLYEVDDPEFDSDEKAIKHLNYLREEYPNRKFKLIIGKRLDTCEAIE